MMAALSYHHADGVFVLCASPIFVTSAEIRDNGLLVFEVFDADSCMLTPLLGVPTLFGMDPAQPPFWGVLTSLIPCESTHLDLRLLRDRPTLRAELRIEKVLTSRDVSSTPN